MKLILNGFKFFSHAENKWDRKVAFLCHDYFNVTIIKSRECSQFELIMILVQANSIDKCSSYALFTGLRITPRKIV